MKTDLDRFVELLVKLLSNLDLNTSLSQLSEQEEAEFNKIASEILHELIINPGGIIFTDKKKKQIHKYKIAIDFLSKAYDDDDISDLLFDSRDELDELLEYENRISKLRPSFINIPPENQKQFYTLYNESMRCWLFGLDNSAVIVITTLLENTFKSILNKSDKLSKLIETAFKRGLITAPFRAEAHNLRIIRNNIIHEGYITNKDESLNLIGKTKEIVEGIYSN